MSENGDRDSLRFESVTVRRMPGYQPPGFSLEGMAPGVNVVHGPNAAGKTTLVRAMNGLLWPGQLSFDRANLEAQFELDEAGWLVSLEAGYRQFQRQGSNHSGPALPPAENSERYRLALHELLQQGTTDRDFAEYIVRELSGGYDIPGAVDKLGFDDSPSGRGNTTRDVENARENVEQARSRMKELEAEESRLRELRRDEQEAREAKLKTECLEQVLEWREAKNNFEDARDHLDTYSDVMEQVTGSEIDDLEALNEEIEVLRKQKEQAREEIQDAEQSLAELDYPYDQPARDVLDELDDRYDTIQQLERTIDDLEAKLSEANEQAEQEASNLVEHFDPDDPGDLEELEYGKLEDFSRRAESVHNQLQAFEKLSKLLGVDAEGENNEVDPGKLERASEVLENWLANPSAGGIVPAKYRYAFFGSISLVTVLSVAAGLLFHPGFFVGLLAVPLLAWYGWPGRGSAGADMRASARREFQQLDVDIVPDEWDAGPVRSTLRQLYARRAEATLCELKQQEWERHAEEYEELQEARDDLAQERRQLAEDYGVEPDTDARTLHIVFNRLSRWQDARSNAAGFEAQLKQKSRKLESELKKVNEEVVDWDLPEVAGAAEVSARITEIKSRTRTFEETKSDLDQAGTALEEAEEELPDLRAEREQLFTDLDLDPGDEAGLRQLCQQVDEYQEARDEKNGKESVLDSEREKMESLEVFEPEYRDYTESELKEQLARTERTAGELEDIRKEINQIETRVSDAKQEYELEPALAEKERAFEVLAEQLHEDYQKLVGHTLGKYIQQVNTRQSIPDVFARAREILADISSGRYELKINQGDPPGFRVVDTSVGRGKSLAELSSGTRIQVLLAVRLAFVTRAEDSVKLPLYMDETLANTDDEKARAIIQSTLRLAEDGRQVIYLTAQGDEVARWQSVGREQAQPVNVLDLAEQTDRKFEGSVTIPGPDSVFTTATSVPSAGGMTHGEYGEELDVPPVAPRRDTGSLHLWYLVEDTAMLEKLLRRNCKTWGQLKTLLDVGSADVVPAELSGEFDRTVQRAQAAAEFFTQWRRGRNRPVDRGVLKDSGAVSDSFIDEVTELAEQVDGAPEQIVEKLRAGAVNRFRTKNMDELEEYFEAEGYIDTREPLEDKLILTSMISAVDETPFENPEQDIKKLFTRLQANIQTSNQEV